MEVGLGHRSVERLGGLRIVGQRRRGDEVGQRLRGPEEEDADADSRGEEHRHPGEGAEFGLLTVLAQRDLAVGREGEDEEGHEHDDGDEVEEPADVERRPVIGGLRDLGDAAGTRDAPDDEGDGERSGDREDDSVQPVVPPLLVDGDAGHEDRMGVVRVVGVRLLGLGRIRYARSSVVELAEAAAGLSAHAFGLGAHPAGVGLDPLAGCAAAGGGVRFGRGRFGGCRVGRCLTRLIRCVVGRSRIGVVRCLPGCADGIVCHLSALSFDCQGNCQPIGDRRSGHTRHDPMRSGNLIGTDAPNRWSRPAIVDRAVDLRIGGGV